MAEIEEVFEIEKSPQGSKSYLLKELKRSAIGHIVYVDQKHAYVTKIDEPNFTMTVRFENDSEKELHFEHGEKPEHPMPLPVAENVLTKRNDFMYQLKKAARSAK